MASVIGHLPKERVQTNSEVAPINLPNVSVADCLGAPENFRMQVELSQPTTTWPRQIRSYAELQEQLHHDLRSQHPQWIDANGNSPMVDWYDQRLAELIALFQSVNKQPVKELATPVMHIALAA